MAKDTSPETRNLVIYEVFVRNHGPHGNFSDVEADLERIRGMGVDVVWFMPIHPIGKINRKGSLGSPYSIVDYRAINPEYGYLSDFTQLIEKAHNLDLKVWIDVVYNHTAHDSVIVSQHPEWFHLDAAGNPVSTVPDWSDVIDLCHPNDDLTDYLIDCLTGWVNLGVDGFRCDVASLLPEQFWTMARIKLREINPKVTLLAESVHADFIRARRLAGLPTISDGEIFRAFDLAYDYDIWPIWQAAVTGHAPISRYLEMVMFQDCIYPENYVKMRCAENHDQARIMRVAPSYDQALAWTAFEAFNKGAFLIYAGEEAGAIHTPSLFDKDPISWNGYELQPFLTALAKLKKDPTIVKGKFVLLKADPVIQAIWSNENTHLYGIFNTAGVEGEIKVPFNDGAYTDILSTDLCIIKNGETTAPKNALIVHYEDHLDIKPFYSDLLHFQIPSD